MWLSSEHFESEFLFQWLYHLVVVKPSESYITSLCLTQLHLQNANLIVICVN